MSGSEPVDRHLEHRVSVVVLGHFARAHVHLQRRDDELGHRQLRVALGAEADEILAGLAVAAQRTFELGSAVEETGSKYRTVFGEGIEDIERFGESFATMAGLSRSQFQELAATGIIVLLVVLLSMNAIAVLLRQWTGRRYGR